MGERYKKILGALKEEELRRPALIQAREKQRVAQESGEVRGLVGLVRVLGTFRAGWLTDPLVPPTTPNPNPPKHKHRRCRRSTCS